MFANGFSGNGVADTIQQALAALEQERRDLSERLAKVRAAIRAMRGLTRKTPQPRATPNGATPVAAEAPPRKNEPVAKSEAVRVADVLLPHRLTMEDIEASIATRYSNVTRALLEIVREHPEGIVARDVLEIYAARMGEHAHLAHAKRNSRLTRLGQLVDGNKLEIKDGKLFIIERNSGPDTGGDENR